MCLWQEFHSLKKTMDIFTKLEMYILKNAFYGHATAQYKQLAIQTERKEFGFPFSFFVFSFSSEVSHTFKAQGTFDRYVWFFC